MITLIIAILALCLGYKLGEEKKILFYMGTDKEKLDRAIFKVDQRR